MQVDDRELFPLDPRCHLCGARRPADDLHWDHEPDCPRGVTCRCDLLVCADCCTEPVCVAARRPIEETAPL